MSLTAMDYLALVYAAAGLLGGVFNVTVSRSRTAWLNADALTTYFSGLVLGGLWSAQGFIEFSDNTGIVARVIVIAATSGFAGDSLRNMVMGMVRRPGNGNVVPPPAAPPTP